MHLAIIIWAIVCSVKTNAAIHADFFFFKSEIYQEDKEKPAAEI